MRSPSGCLIDQMRILQPCRKILPASYASKLPHAVLQLFVGGTSPVACRVVFLAAYAFLLFGVFLVDRAVSRAVEVSTNYTDCLK